MQPNHHNPLPSSSKQIGYDFTLPNNSAPSPPVRWYVPGANATLIYQKPHSPDSGWIRSNGPAQLATELVATTLDILRPWPNQPIRATTTSVQHTTQLSLSPETRQPEKTNEDEQAKPLRPQSSLISSDGSEQCNIGTFGRPVELHPSIGTYMAVGSMHNSFAIRHDVPHTIPACEWMPPPRLRSAEPSQCGMRLAQLPRI
ncbi:hypothetical protein F4804DRAFT_305719 [Jackrogersella minutella]|nr:hypothetical protein F4804DRAFT_305719 [Jackrogersella minutella]